MRVNYHAWIVAWAPFLATIPTEASSIRKPSSRQEGSTTHQIDTERFLADAPPRKSNRHRNLQDIQLTGNDSIVFRSCETLSVEASADNANLQEAINSGDVTSVMSFVEFDVCQSASCYSNVAGSRTTYVTSLADYLAALSEFLPSKQQEYCDACLENFDYCLNQQRNNGRRDLAGDVSYQTLDCGRCFSYGCMYNSNALYRTTQEWTQTQSMEWIQGVSKCYQNRDNPVTVNGQRVSFGFMCNQEGTGVEIAVFMDDDCTLYNRKVAFGNVMSTADYMMWSKTKTNVQYIFNNDFSCYDPDIQYVRPENYDGNIANNGNNQGEDYAPDAGEWCLNLFDGDMTPVAMADCVDSNEVATGTESNGYYNFTLSSDDAQNATAICSKLTSNGGGEHIYSRYGSGAMYRYNSKSTNPFDASYTGTGDTTRNSNSSNWLSALDSMALQYRNHSGDRGAKIGWICGTALVVVIAVALVVDRVRKSSPADNKEPILPDQPRYKRRFFRARLIRT